MIVQNAFGNIKRMGSAQTNSAVMLANCRAMKLNISTVQSPTDGPNFVNTLI